MKVWFLAVPIVVAAVAGGLLATRCAKDALEDVNERAVGDILDREVGAAFAGFTEAFGNGGSLASYWAASCTDAQVARMESDAQTVAGFIGIAGPIEVTVTDDIVVEFLGEGRYRVPLDQPPGGAMIIQGGQPFTDEDDPLLLPAPPVFVYEGDGWKVDCPWLSEAIRDESTSSR